MTSVIGTLVDQLNKKDEKVVLAESCTGGLISASLVEVPGISNHLCGSFVTYRPKSKRKWLGVKSQTIEEHTTESEEVAEEMACGALKRTKEASWSVGVVGHLGPYKGKDSKAKSKDRVFISIWRRTKRGKLKLKENFECELEGTDRNKKLRAATEQALVLFGRVLLQHNKKQSKKQKKDELETANQ